MTVDDAVERAVAAMEDLGLTEYQARCFVGLLRIGRATAREVSQTAGIPRSRVYDLADTLADRGLVVTYDTSPRTFQAASPETALETLERDHHKRIEFAAEALGEVERIEPSHPTREGGTTVTGHDRILDRCRKLIGMADREVLLVLDSDRCTEELSESLTAALDRGASVLVGIVDADARSRIENELPGVTAFEPLPSWSEFADGVVRALLVNRHAVLMSAHDADREVAVWDQSAGLATVLVPILERQVRHALDQDGD